MATAQHIVKFPLESGMTVGGLIAALEQIDPELQLKVAIETTSYAQISDDATQPRVSLRAEWTELVGEKIADDTDVHNFVSVCDACGRVSGCGACCGTH